MEEAERLLASRDRASTRRTPGAAPADPSAAAALEETNDNPFSMGSLSVYGYRVHDDELESDLKKATEEAGEERDFAEKWDDDNPEDRVAVAVADVEKLSSAERDLQKTLKRSARQEKKQPAAADEEDSDEDSVEEFVRGMEQDHDAATSAAKQDEVRRRKRKAEDEAASQAKRAKLNPGQVTREDMLEHVRQILRARPNMPKKEFIAALALKIPTVKEEKNRLLLVDVIRFAAATRKAEDGTDLLYLKDDLFNK